MNLPFVPKWYVPPHLRAPRRISGEAIIHAVQREFGLTRTELNGASRQRRFVRARQISWYLMSKNCPAITFPLMARMLGKSDHTTAMHGITAISNLLPRDSVLSDTVERIQDMVLHGARD